MSVSQEAKAAYPRLSVPSITLSRGRACIAATKVAIAQRFPRLSANESQDDGRFKSMGEETERGAEAPRCRLHLPATCRANPKQRWDAHRICGER
jgi:hypothetical protein